MKNIRHHVLAAIRDGLAASITVIDAVPGVLFADENEFIPFADLGYSADLGYFRLSAFPEQANECDSTNPETIHPYGAADGWQAWVWMDADGMPHQLGEAWQVADLYQTLKAFLRKGEHDRRVVDELDPVWGQSYAVADAVREALAVGYSFDPEQMGNTIRVAAQKGRIRGAVQRNGRWLLPRLSFRDWLRRSQSDKRGRPRSE